MAINPTFDKLNVFDLADDDRLWTARCTLDTIADLFEDPLEWMKFLTREAQAKGLIKADEELKTADVLTIKMVPVQESASEQMSALLSNRDDYSMRQFLSAQEGVGTEEALANAAAQPHGIVMGLNGTGYISIEPSIHVATAAFAGDPAWDGYWDTWINQSPVILTVLPEDGIAMLHLDLTKENDVDKGKRIAAFMVGGSRSTDKLNAFLEAAKGRWELRTPPGAAELDKESLAFQPFDSQSLSRMTFLYISEPNDKKEACEVLHGTYLPGPPPVIIPLGSTAKDYPHAT